MNIKDVFFEPHCDGGADDIDLFKEHDALIKNNKITDAVSLLNKNHYKKGFRAFVFNTIQSKIRDLEIYILNKIAESDEYYSFEEPSEEEMKGKKFWIKVY